MISEYTPQVGCEQEEQEFWNEVEAEIQTIPRGERIVIGTDFIGNVGECNKGDGNVMGKCDIEERNTEGQICV